MGWIVGAIRVPRDDDARVVDEAARGRRHRRGARLAVACRARSRLHSLIADAPRGDRRS